MGIFTKLKEFVGLSEAQEYEYEYDDRSAAEYQDLYPEDNSSTANASVNNAQGFTGNTTVNPTASNTRYAPPPVNQDLFNGQWPEEDNNPRNSQSQAPINADVFLTPGGDDESDGFYAPRRRRTGFNSAPPQPFASPFTANGWEQPDNFQSRPPAVDAFERNFGFKIQENHANLISAIAQTPTGQEISFRNEGVVTVEPARLTAREFNNPSDKAIAAALMIANIKNNKNWPSVAINGKDQAMMDNVFIEATLQGVEIDWTKSSFTPSPEAELTLATRAKMADPRINMNDGLGGTFNYKNAFGVSTYESRDLPPPPAQTNAAEYEVPEWLLRRRTQSSPTNEPPPIPTVTPRTVKL